jgi:hypothetical protein
LIKPKKSDLTLRPETRRHVVVNECSKTIQPLIPIIGTKVGEEAAYEELRIPAPAGRYYLSSTNRREEEECGKEQIFSDHWISLERENSRVTTRAGHNFDPPHRSSTTI